MSMFLPFITFCCTSYRLPMEAGQQQNLPGEDRKCLKCFLSVAEDNFIFFFNARHTLNTVENLFLKKPNNFFNQL